MKKLGMLFLSTVALVSAQAAQATTYTPAGTFTATGTLTVQKGLTLNCAATFTIAVPEAAPDAHGSFSHGHSANVTGATLTGGLCPLVTLNNLPWTVTYDGTNLIFTGVAASTITPGGCLPGTIQGAWNNTARTVTFVNQTLTGGSGSANCIINGTLTVNPTISITNP